MDTETEDVAKKYISEETKATINIGQLLGINLEPFQHMLRTEIQSEVMINQQKAMKQKKTLLRVPQPKQESQMEAAEQPTRNWLDLPSEVTANILYRVGVVDILQSAQKVCTAWREICKDPAMWRVVYMDPANLALGENDMCKHAVDRSQGQLVDITILEFGNEEILEYIANRGSQLKRLTIVYCDDNMDDIWTESLKKFPLLEELSLYATEISEEGIESAGRYCSMLKTLKVNKEDYRIWDYYSDDEADYMKNDGIAMAIAQNLHELRHLELIGNTMSNEGLEMILDGCQQLESLDLRGCLCINLDGDLGKRCSQQIKCLKLPKDSLEGCPFIYKNDGMTFDVDDEFYGGSYYEPDMFF